MPSHLITPYGGELVQPLASAERQQELKAAASDWPSWPLSTRQLCDLELILNGALSPLEGFMGRRDYESVCETMRLGDGTLWPLPVVLDVNEAFAKKLEPGRHLALRDVEGVMVAVIHVQEIWRPDLYESARQVFGTDDPSHPGVQQMLDQTHPVHLGGDLEGLELPSHYDFRLLRHTPEELRHHFTRRGWRRIMAFHTRQPMHRLQHAITFQAAREHQVNLLIHPVVGDSEPGDAGHFTRIRCYQEVLSHYPRHTATLSLLPLWPRQAGPREALLHAIVRRNYGCSHLLVGCDHASPEADIALRSSSARAKGFYEPYAAQALCQEHQNELGIQIVPVQETLWVKEQSEFLPADQVPQGSTPIRFSAAELRDRLVRGRSIPPWISFSQVITELTRAYPSRHKQGFTVFFTGLSGAGKSTIANVLLVRLLELGGRPVTLLDGDIVRRNLSSELTFSKEHRDINIRRIGFVASEITKNGGIALCAPIAPYDHVRKEVREMISARGGFVLVHVATPLEVCETRDRKGMYAKARAGIVKEFTGISDPYEEPLDAEIIIDTTDLDPSQCTQQVLLYLEKEGYIGGNEINGQDIR